MMPEPLEIRLSEFLSECEGTTVASSRMQVTPSRTLSASRTPGSVPSRAVAGAHACRRAVLTAAVTRVSAPLPPRAIS